MAIDTTSLKKIASFFLITILSLNLLFPPFALAQLQNVVDITKEDNVFLYVGDLVTLKVKSLTKVAVANPGVVDITNASEDEMTLVGRKVGETQVFIWDQNGKKQILARVVSTDLNTIANRIASLIQSAGIEGVSFEKNYNEGKILLTGYLNKNQKKKLDEIISNFSDSIINLVVEEGELIQIDVQFSELDTTLTKTLGFDWTTGTALSFSFSEALPTQDGSFADLFKVGDFSRTSAIVSVVDLLISEGKGRILSKPSLVVTNGEQASFLVGGEIPVRTTSTAVGGGSVQENVSFKDYGVELTVTPELRDGKIDIQVNVTVRDIDTSNAVGNDVAFLTRTATTKVRLLDAQTIVLAGMIQRRQSETVKRVPFLSKVPVVGMLFKSKNTPSNEQELVVSLTPRILRNLPINKVEKDTKSRLENQEASKTSSPESLSQKTESSVKRIEPVSSEKEQEAALSAAIKDGSSQITSDKTTKTDLPKSVAQLKAEQKAAKKKAKADAKAAAKLKKQKAKQAKREKKAKALAERNAKKSATPKAKTDKVVKPGSAKPANKQPALDDKISEPKNEIQKSLDDPSLNMALDDPRFSDPQNVLTDEEIAAIKEKYGNKIKQQLSETISYPYEAKESGWEGTVVLNITILPDGNLKNVAVNKSSGYAIFDKDAVNTAEILSPYDRFMPAKNMRELEFSVAVEYSEKAILGTPVPGKN